MQLIDLMVEDIKDNLVDASPLDVGKLQGKVQGLQQLKLNMQRKELPLPKKMEQ